MDTGLILHKRNKLLVYILWLSLILGIAVNVVTQPSQTWILATVGGLICLGATVLVWRRWLSGYMMYYIAISMAVITYVLIATSDGFLTYLMVYYSIAVCTLYNRFFPTILSGLFALAFTNYFFFAQRDTLFAAFKDADLLTLNLFVVLITGALAASGVFGERLQRQLAERQLELVTANGQSGEVLQYITESVKVLDQFNAALKSNVDSTGTISREMTAAFGEISKSTESASSSLGTVNESLVSLKEEITAISGAAAQLRELSASSAELTDGGAQKAAQLRVEIAKTKTIMDTTVDLIRDLNQRNEKIGEILLVIHGIAEQTHLLSLNAAIEAVKAGDHGRGFTVLAAEIRKLSDNARSSTEHISEILQQIADQTVHVSNQVLEGQQAAAQGQSVSEEMIASLNELLQNAQQVAGSSTEMEHTVTRFTDASQSIAQEMNTLSAMTEQNMAAVEQITSGMESQDRKISDIVARFHELDAIIQGLSAKTGV